MGVYLKETARRTKKRLFFLFLNIIVISMGISSCLLIFLYIKNEFSFDRFHKNGDRIFRLACDLKLDIGTKGYAVVRTDVARAMANVFPEIEKIAIVDQLGIRVATYQDIPYEIKGISADPAFFDVFSFPLITGDTKSFTLRPDSAFITESAAKRIFGAGEPLGKILRSEEGDAFTICGILADIPKESHLQFDLAVSNAIRLRQEKTIGFSLCNNYFLLNVESSYVSLEKKFPDFILNRFGSRDAKNRYYLQPITSIHWDSSLFGPGESQNSDLKYPSYIVLIGIMIMIMACFNYINLSSALTSLREREITIKYVLGAGKKLVFFQSLGESMIISLLAMVPAIFVARIALPVFNLLVKKEVEFVVFNDWRVLVFLIGLVFLVGIAAGLYPAYCISSAKPAHSLKTGILPRSKLALIRKGVVIIQYMVACVILSLLFVVYFQYMYITKRDLGYDPTRLLYTHIDISNEDRTNTWKTEILKEPSIEAAALSEPELGKDFDWPRIVHPEGFPRGDAIKFLVFSVDPDYFQTIGARIVQGRSFNHLSKSEERSAVIINETAARMLNWKVSTGKYIEMDTSVKRGQYGIVKATVIGVVQDFHIGSLRQVIQPAVFIWDRFSYFNLVVKFRPGMETSVQNALRQKWKTIHPEQPFYCKRVIDNIADSYEPERITGWVVAAASVFLVVISSLGLFGLSAFDAGSRLREMSIRIAIGASRGQVIWEFTRSFLQTGCLSIFAASIPAWYLGARWLQQFPYREESMWHAFLMSALISISISFMSIGYHTVKLAMSKPADVLRYE